MAKKKDDMISRSVLVGELEGVKRFMEKTFTRSELRSDVEYNRVVRLLRWIKDLPADGLPPAPVAATRLCTGFSWPSESRNVPP